MFTLIQNKKLYMLAVDQIKGLIEQEKLKPGDKLPSERKLSNLLSLSRSTTREAIAALEIMGYIEVRVGVGTFIKEVGNNNKDIIESDLNSSPTELFEARILIEPIISRLAAQRATAEDIENMKEILFEGYHPDTEKPQEAEKRDQRFHLAIAKATYNEALYKFDELINIERTSKLWTNIRIHSLEKEGRIDNYQNEHYEIFNAIKDKDQKLAEKLTLKHLEKIRKEFLILGFDK